MKKLFDDYYYEIVSNENFSNFFSKNREEVFKDHFSFDFSDFHSKLEIERNEHHYSKEKYRLNILIYKEEAIIGWHFGFEEGVNYYMCNTGIFNEFQNQGIYSALLPIILKILRTKGFLKITSKHVASNNAVIVPKLKNGFVLSGMHVHEKFGTMVDLTFYNNPKMKEAYLMRTGEKKLDNL